MSRNNFFALPTDDQLSSLQNSGNGTQNASQAMGLPSLSAQNAAASPSFLSSTTATASPQPMLGNSGGNGTPSDLPPMDTQTMQQMMTMLQTMMNTNTSNTNSPTPTQSKPQSAQQQQPKNQLQPSKPTPTAQQPQPAAPKPQPISPTSAPISQYRYPSPMSDQIYVGGAADARNKISLKNNDIQFILNLCPQSLPQFFPSDFIYKDFNISDDHIKVFDLWKEIKTYLDNCLASGMKVFLHDETGEWKSSCIAIAYLCTLFHWTLKESYDFCKGRRREIKLPPQALVALGNWEITTLGSSTLHEIVLTKKQKGNLTGIGGGQLIEDKSLQGFLSNRQARSFFDDYESQIIQLTLQHRDISAQYNQIKTYVAQLENKNTNVTPVTTHNMQEYCPIVEISPYINYFQQYDSMLQEFNSIFGSILKDFSTSSSTTMTSNPSSQLSQVKFLPDDMKLIYNSLHKYITQHSSTLLQPNSTFNLPLNNSSTYISPLYPQVCAITATGYLTFTQYEHPVHPTNHPDTKNTLQIQSTSTICLFCSAISSSVRLEICSCASKRQDLLELLNNGRKQHGFDTIPKDTKTNFFTLYLISLLYPDLFNQTMYTIPSMTSQGNELDYNSTSSKLIKLHSNISKLRTHLDTQVASTLLSVSNKPYIIGDQTTPGQIDPQLQSLSKQAITDLSTLFTSLENIIKSLQLTTSVQESQFQQSLLSQRVEYIINIHRFAEQIDAISTHHQQQLLAQYLLMSSSVSGDTLTMAKLQSQIDSLTNELETLKIVKENGEKEKQFSIDDLNSQLISLRSQSGDVDEAVSKLQSELDVEREKNKELNDAKKELIDNSDLDGEKIDSLEASEKTLQVENSTLLVQLAALEAEFAKYKDNIGRQDSSLNEARHAQLLEISSDDERLQLETIKQVIYILRSQKIWLGIQLGLTKHDFIRTAYSASLTPQQLQVGLNGHVPDAFIYVMQVTPESVSSKCGILPNDIIVSFNGSLISSVKQIHAISTEITPGERIALAILRPNEKNAQQYHPMVLSMETRSRLLSINQLSLLHSIHRGETRSTPETLQQVMELKDLCDRDTAGQNVGSTLMEQRRSSLPQLSLESQASAISNTPISPNNNRLSSLGNLTLGRTFSLQNTSDQVDAETIPTTPKK